jgi:hypothetical protein
MQQLHAEDNFLKHPSNNWELNNVYFFVSSPSLVSRRSMKSSAKLRKEMETGKQSGVALPAGPCRVGEARPQKHTETNHMYFTTLQTICSSSFLALRLRLRRRCAAQRGVEKVCPFRASEERARKQQPRHVNKIAALFAKGGSGLSVQLCRRGTVRFLCWSLPCPETANRAALKHL